jgi:hypothetical protein
MLFTDSACRPQGLTEVTTHRLRASDSVERYLDCGWHCATGYKDGRVQIVVHAASKAELDRALGGGVETKSKLSVGTHRRRKHRKSTEIHGLPSRFSRNEVVTTSP